MNFEMQYTFLICSERSGSNFITSLLNGHPDLCGPPPTHMFRLFGLNIGNYGDLEGESRSAFLRDFFDARETIFSDWNTRFSSDELAEACGEGSVVRSAFDFMYGAECNADGAQQVVVKENHTYRIVPFLETFWPSARYVYQVRDPRDVAASWVKTDSIPGGVEKAVEVWLEDQAETRLLLETGSLADRVYTVRYEDLIDDTPAELRKLCAHLGVEYTPEMLEFYNDQRTVKNASQIDAWSNLSKPVLSGNAGKYKSTLSPDDILYIELMCADLMDRHGYETDHDVSGQSADERRVASEALRSSLTPGAARRFDTEEEGRRRARRQSLIDRVVRGQQAAS